MIVHMVLWKLADEALGADKAANAARLKREIEALRDKVPGVGRLDVGVGIEGSDAAWDLALYAEFDTPADLVAYQAHPEHEKVKELLAQVRTDRAVVDYEV